MYKKKKKTAVYPSEMRQQAIRQDRRSRYRRGRRDDRFLPSRIQRHPRSQRRRQELFVKDDYRYEEPLYHSLTLRVSTA